MEKIKLVESFEDLPSVSLTETTSVQEASTPTKSRVDGKYIIGMIEGQFFKPDGMSRNGRYYPKELWEKVLSSADFKNRKLYSTIFGEIGHSEGPVEDMTLRMGMASHFVDDLWITPKNEGYGRIYILNTPTGNLLKTYLGAGCKLKVSTRGEGTYCESYQKDGHPVVDPNTYEFQTVDFVMNPGFIETSAYLKEEYDKTLESLKDEKVLQKFAKFNETKIEQTNKKGETSMALTPESMYEKLEKENEQLKAKVESLTAEVAAKDKKLLEAQFKVDAEVQKISEAYEPFKKLNVSAKTITETLKRSQASLKEAKEQNKKLNESLKAYQEKAGSLKELDEATELSNKALTRLCAYNKLVGSITEAKQLKENAEKACEVLSEAKRLRNNAEKALEMIKEAKKLEGYASKAADLLEQYKKIGTIKELKALKEGAKVEAAKTSKSEAVAFSKKYRCTVENAAKLISKYGNEKAIELIEKKLATKKANVKNITEGTKLVEDETKLDPQVKQEEKTAKDYLTKGMIVNKFNPAAFGTQIGPKDVNDIGTYNDARKENIATELLKKYGAVKTEEPEIKVDGELSQEDADKIAKKLLQ